LQLSVEQHIKQFFGVFVALSHIDFVEHDHSTFYPFLVYEFVLTTIHLPSSTLYGQVFTTFVNSEPKCRPTKHLSDVFFVDIEHSSLLQLSVEQHIKQFFGVFVALSHIDFVEHDHSIPFFVSEFVLTIIHLSYSPLSGQVLTYFVTSEPTTVEPTKHLSDVFVVESEHSSLLQLSVEQQYTHYLY